MNIEVTERKTVGILDISGRLDASNCSDLKKKFKSIVDKYPHFILDLERMEFIDSTGLGAIVACLKYGVEKKSTVKIVNLQKKPRIVFEVTRAYKIFDIYDDLESAIEACDD